MLYLLLVVGLLFCAVQTIHAERLLAAALWLASLSALLSIFLYALGAPEIAVIELSVGAGLLTVLLVFAVSITGDSASTARALVPRPLAWGLLALASLLLAWAIVPEPELGLYVPNAGPAFGRVLWHERGLDVLGQVALIFVGAIGVLGLLDDSGSEGTQTAKMPGRPSAFPEEAPTVLPLHDTPSEPEAELEEVCV
jgi:uncharacterized MnhB-related membrane protein